MEFKARYALTGIFTLAVIANIFAFVYWLNNSAGFGERSRYRIEFPEPVSGLASGSNVYFNGIKVGEVIALSFDENVPSGLVATISVDSATPVRKDTIAGVSFQGLTGAANVLLTGASNTAPLLSQEGVALPVLVADPANTRSWTDAAGRVLGKLEKWFGSNSGKFDSILAGLERMTGGGAAAPGPLVDLPVPATIEIADLNPEWTLAVAEPTIELALNTDKVQEQAAEGVWSALGDVRWTDNLPNLFQTRTLQAFENAGLEKSVLRPADILDPQFRLVLDIRGLYLKAYGEPAARIDFIARIIDQDGVVVASRHFEEEVPVAATGSAEVVPVLRELFSATMSRLVLWTVGEIGTATANQ
jgi:phospholipid/cholesterol/gamma-HCH transport system substrate-binding protein